MPLGSKDSKTIAVNKKGDIWLSSPLLHHHHQPPLSSCPPPLSHWVLFRVLRRLFLVNDPSSSHSMLGQAMLEEKKVLGKHMEVKFCVFKQEWDSA